jgi:hypothetical protein
MIDSKDKIILVDCDGVLLDWVYAFEVYQETNGIVVNDTAEYDIGKRYNLTSEQGKRAVRVFNDSAAIGFLPPLRDAVYYIKRLYMRHGYKFHVITSLSSDKHAQKLRVMNLEMLFGAEVFDGFTFRACGASKETALAKWEGSNCYWIEDLIGNADDGAKFGLDPIIVAHDWNSNSNYPRFSNWKHIYRHITD